MPTPDLQRIAYFTSCFPRASDTFIQTEIAQLRRQGFEVRTFAVRRPALQQRACKTTGDAHETEYLLEAGALLLLFELVRFAAVRPMQFVRTVRQMFRLGAPGVASRLKHIIYLAEAARLAARLQQLQVLHLHNHIGESSATVAALASSLCGVPFSLTIHGPGIFYHPRRWALREKIAAASFTACISRYCLSQCMTFADVSDWHRLQLVRCCPGADFERPPGRDIRPEAGFLFVGRLCQEKGIPYLVEAIRRLADRHPAVKLDVIGRGPLEGLLREQIAEHGLGENISLLGWKSSAEVREAILRSRALVLPSFAEGLPVVLMESLALRRPVITTRIAAIGELVEDGVSGWLVDPASAEALVDALQQALDASPAKLLEMGEAGARRVARQHRATEEAAKLASLFRRSITIGPATRRLAPDNASHPVPPAAESLV